MFIERRRARRDKRPDAHKREPLPRVFRGEVGKEAAADIRSAAKEKKPLCARSITRQDYTFDAGTEVGFSSLGLADGWQRA